MKKENLRKGNFKIFCTKSTTCSFDIYTFAKYNFYSYNGNYNYQDVPFP